MLKKLKSHWKVVWDTRVHKLQSSSNSCKYHSLQISLLQISLLQTPKYRLEFLLSQLFLPTCWVSALLLVSIGKIVQRNRLPDPPCCRHYSAQNPDDSHWASKSLLFALLTEWTSRSDIRAIWHLPACRRLLSNIRSCSKRRPVMVVTYQALQRFRRLKALMLNLSFPPKQYSSWTGLCWRLTLSESSSWNSHKCSIRQ